MWFDPYGGEERLGREAEAGEERGRGRRLGLGERRPDDEIIDDKLLGLALESDAPTLLEEALEYKLLLDLAQQEQAKEGGEEGVGQVEEEEHGPGEEQLPVEELTEEGPQEVGDETETEGLCPVSPHSASTALFTSSAVYASGFRPHVRGRHSSVPTGLGLGPQPSPDSPRARGQDTNKARV